MLEFLKAEANKTVTENGEVTNITTNSFCLDLFATIGALRNRNRTEIVNRFVRAMAENPDLAVKIAFFARDIREGLGEREIFKTILTYLAFNYPKTVEKNLQFIPEFGRFDDLLCLIDTPCEDCAINFIKNQLDSDLENLRNGGEVSLLAKWLPSVNTSNRLARNNARKIATKLGLNYKEYRKMLVALREKIKIIENNLREKDYSFDYSKQPSMAMLKYRQAFARNDGERYLEYLRQVKEGNKKINTATLTPFDLVRAVYNKILDDSEKETLNTAWANLPNYGDNTNALVVIDTSGSMDWPNHMPISVAISLGLYFAERNTGVFANHFIEFSHKPVLIEIKGNTFDEKVKYIKSFNEVADTNIEAVYDLILQTAVKNELKQEDLPERLIFISDMEFNCCTQNASISNFENAKNNFAKYGYKLPEIVFWNVDSRIEHHPVTKNEQGVALVSGFSPKIFEMVAQGHTNPYDFMLQVLNTERYNAITA